MQVTDPNAIRYLSEIKIADLIAISECRRQQVFKILEEKKSAPAPTTPAPKPAVKPEPNPAPKIVAPAHNPEDDYEFIDFSSATLSRTASTERTARLYTNKGHSTVTLSAPVASEVLERGLTHVRVRKDKLTGCIHLVFTHDVGLALPSKRSAKSTIAIHNKAFYEFLADTFSCCSGDTLELSENLANTKDFATYKITKK